MRRHEFSKQICLRDLSKEWFITCRLDFVFLKGECPLKMSPCVYSKDETKSEYLSAMFTMDFPWAIRTKCFIFTCTISILDAKGNIRFPRSFAAKCRHYRTLLCSETASEELNPHQPFGIEKYVKKKHLDEDKLEFSSGGMFTLQFDIIIEYELAKSVIDAVFTSPIHRDFLPFEMLQNISMLDDISLDTMYPLRINFQSPLLEVMRRESQYFDRLFSNDMKEKRTGIFCIPQDEINDFRNMNHYFTSNSLDHVHSMEAYFGLYGISHKYEVLKLNALCSDYISRHLRPIFVAEVLALAYDYEDEYLKNSVILYIRSHEKQIFCTENWQDFENERPDIVRDIRMWEDKSTEYCTRQEEIALLRRELIEYKNNPLKLKKNDKFDFYQ